MAHRFGIGLLIVVTTTCPAADQPLLDVGEGRLPNDTALEGRTKLSIASHEGIGGRALEVVFAEGDTFGMARQSSDWRGAEAITFRAFNPVRERVKLVFTVRHRGTTGFKTRVDLPFELEPGRNEVRLDVGKARNVDGSKPDLSLVRHWYVAPADGAPTLYFGNITLVMGQSPDTPTRVATDPARVARIRAARMPKVERPVRFDTPEADAILSALEVFPADNAFNQVVEEWPLHPNSAAIVGSIGRDKPFRYNPDMAFVIVPPDQRRVPVRVVDYPDESDTGPFPVPDSVPIEGWPVAYTRGKSDPPTLADLQRRPVRYEGDRHAIVVDPVNRRLHEFFTFGRTPDGWAAGQASTFDLSSNELRPDGWTSADAAGLPIFPAVVRYDELQRGLVEHAMRVTVRRSRRAYVHPATHFASRLENENLPRMGERLRLRADFDVRGFSKPVRAILLGLKKYGMLVADNGIEWAISVAPDPRIPDLHAELRKVRGSDFEVVVAPR